MDEMKIKLSTGFMNSIASKVLARSIYKKTGYKVTIQLEDLDISFVDGETEIKAKVEAKLDSKEFVKIIKSNGLD
jgi:hypothetical protein|nr:MAG TPA: hypothetical protein [Caudoviricetes sp.]